MAGDEVNQGLDRGAWEQMGVAFSRARPTLWLTPKMENRKSPRIWPFSVRAQTNQIKALRIQSELCNWGKEESGSPGYSQTIRVQVLGPHFLAGLSSLTSLRLSFLICKMESND